MGVRLCTSAQLRMLLELLNSNLRCFAQGSGQPLTAAWLCFMLKYGCQAPIAANAAVGCSALFEYCISFALHHHLSYHEQPRIFRYVFANKLNIFQCI